MMIRELYIITAILAFLACGCSLSEEKKNVHNARGASGKPAPVTVDNATATARAITGGLNESLQSSGRPAGLTILPGLEPLPIAVLEPESNGGDASGFVTESYAVKSRYLFDINKGQHPEGTYFSVVNHLSDIKVKPDSINITVEKAGGENAEAIEEFQHHLERHRDHVQKLETLLRMLDNDNVNIDQVNK